MYTHLLEQSHHHQQYDLSLLQLNYFLVYRMFRVLNLYVFVVLFVNVVYISISTHTCINTDENHFNVLFNFFSINSNCFYCTMSGSIDPSHPTNIYKKKCWEWVLETRICKWSCLLVAAQMKSTKKQGAKLKRFKATSYEVDLSA